MKKVIIKSISTPCKYGMDRESTEVYIDGNLIGMGSYGGEPEDNMKCRDYSWVEPLIKSLAEKLGAEVETINLTETE